MKKIQLGPTSLSVSAISLGCMRMNGLSVSGAAEVLAASLECGIDFFDHADIYGGGGSEEIFAAALEAVKVDRENLFLQSKCGIRQGFFDFSEAHILASVDGILKRLQTDYLDVLLLHRPDALMEPEEIASAFSRLQAAGKVRHFGVSNQNPTQMALIQQAMEIPLVANQLQFSLGHTSLVDHGLNVNMADEPGVDRDGGIIDYCRLHRVTVQPWSPLQAGFFGGVFLGHPEFLELNEVLNELAETHGVTASAVAIAWLLRHPAQMQPVLGSMTPQRIREMCQACAVDLSRPDWYRLYRAAGNRLP
ncbi:MAG: aldo/keto reductase family oxidoreductase [Puniceicoccaceae bacterium]